jgi:hypothetical protein
MEISKIKVSNTNYDIVASSLDESCALTEEEVEEIVLMYFNVGDLESQNKHT